MPMQQHILRDYEFCDIGVVWPDDDELARVATALGEEPRNGGRTVVVLNAMGVAVARKGEFAEAVKLFDEAIRAEPDSWKLYTNRAEAYLFLGQYDRAVYEVQEAFRVAPDSELRPLRVRARTYFELREFERAIDDYTAYLEAYPHDAKSWAMRGLTRHYAGYPDESIPDFDRSLEINANDAWALGARGWAKRSIEDFEGAIADFTTAISKAPDKAEHYLERGQVLLHIGKTEEAIEDFDRAVELEPENAAAYFLRATAYLEKDGQEQARADLTTSLQLDPTNKDALELSAAVWERLGESQKAEADLQQIDELPSIGRRRRATMQTRNKEVHHLVRKHFSPNSLDDLSIVERRFPMRVRADLQRAVDRLLADEVTVCHFSGVRKQHAFEGVNFPELMVNDERDPVLAVPPQYEDVDIGGGERIRCLKSGLWLLEKENQKFALFLEPPSRWGRHGGIRFQLACVNDEPGAAVADRFFKEFEASVASSECYRGKILSLELQEDYAGTSSGITVHRLRQVERDQVILPEKTLELLERNVIQFIRQRPRLRQLGMSTKKGLLFYGPPGTGKTHTIHYLAKGLEGHTTLLISAEQVALLSEYMTLARLLQPSIVVMEDVDLIARDRAQMDSPCEEVLLNKLLNEMDGLHEEADILFILTTNRPEALEAALASRPGRIDQAIEFPLPDEMGRRKLVELYSGSLSLSEHLVSEIVRRTEGVSAAFIKELMRRTAQFAIEGNGEGEITHQHLDGALDEMLFKGGSLNLKILGGSDRETVEA